MSLTGYGDIHPSNAVSRAIVTLQMLTAVTYMVLILGEGVGFFLNTLYPDDTTEPLLDHTVMDEDFGDIPSPPQSCYGSVDAARGAIPNPARRTATPPGHNPFAIPEIRTESSGSSTGSRTSSRTGSSSRRRSSPGNAGKGDRAEFGSPPPVYPGEQQQQAISDIESLLIEGVGSDLSAPSEPPPEHSSSADPPRKRAKESRSSRKEKDSSGKESRSTRKDKDKDKDNGTKSKRSSKHSNKQSNKQSNKKQRKAPARNKQRPTTQDNPEGQQMGVSVSLSVLPGGDTAGQETQARPKPSITGGWMYTE